mmetsp:Transcript_33641/g.65643  ORF Transcript_33641/g.65643 Transcript_33641/m.65643 type:complete len:319 (-) Transcript_33641:721-1677(-)
MRQLLHHVVLVAHVDQRPRVDKLRLSLEKILDLLGGVVLALSGDALELLEVVLHQTNPGAGYNVLVVHALVLRKVDDGPQVVVQALHALVLLEEVDEGGGRHELRVLGRDLHADLKVLADVLGKHLAQELDRPVDVQVAKPLKHKLALHLPRVHNHPLEILQLRIVLQRALIQPRPLAQASNVRAVVVRQHAVGEDRLRDLGGGPEVDLKQLGLQVRLLRLVALERIEEEARCLLHHVALQEEVRYRLEIDLAALLVHEHLSEMHSTLRVQHHHVLQDLRPLRLVPNLVGVEEDLVVLLRLDKAVNHLGGHVCPQIDR